MTFSIIVPVYNVEKYLARCLDSVLGQSYTDFEVIVVNDGSPDNSQNIIDEYAKKHPDKIKAFIKENGGLSDARNFGIKRALGDYLLFVDSDDYLSCDLLLHLKEASDQNRADLVRFCAQTVFENGDIGQIYSCPKMSGIGGEEAISRLIDYKQMFEPAPFYVYKRAFWLENGFVFETGRNHEDFGLVPEIIMKAKWVSSTDYIGYNYVQTSTSITRGNAQAAVKGANDVLYLVTKLREITKKCGFAKEVHNKVLSYLANAAIYVVDNLSGEAKIAYIKKLNKEKIFDMLLEDTLKRKVKKIYMKLKYGAYK